MAQASVPAPIARGTGQGLADVLRGFVPSATDDYWTRQQTVRGESPTLSDQIRDSLLAAATTEAPSPGSTSAPATTPPATDEEDDPIKIIEKLFPRRDYLKELREAQPGPQGPGEFQLSPWEIAAFALPAILGAVTGRGTRGFGASGAMLEGALTGHLTRTQQAKQDQAAYEKRIADIADKMSEEDYRRANLTLPFVLEKAGEKRRNAITEARLAMDQQRARFQQDLATARFAFDQFRWANPSAYQQQQVQLKQIDQRIAEARARADEALAAGRLDEARRHNGVVEDLTRQARELTRQQVAIAWGNLKVAQEKAARGDPTDLINLYKFVQDQAQDLKLKLGDVFSQFTDAQRKEFEEDLRKYADQESRLRPIVQQYINQQQGTPAPTAPMAPAAPAQSKEKTYTIRSGPQAGQTMTSSQIQAMIRESLAGGKSREWVRKALIALGIPPENFGF